MERFARITLFTTAGLLIWAADFLFTYVFTALAIAKGFADLHVLGISIITLAVIIATLVAAGATVIVLRKGLRGYRTASQESQPGIERFVYYLAAAVAALALVAIVWNAFPAWVA